MTLVLKYPCSTFQKYKNQKYKYNKRTAEIIMYSLTFPEIFLKTYKFDNYYRNN